jgi:hypothetical protein
VLISQERKSGNQKILSLSLNNSVIIGRQV